MRLGLFALDQYIIHVDFHVSPKLGAEYFLHKPLVCCTRILQAQRYDLVKVRSYGYDKRNLALVGRVERNLVISLRCIHHAQHLRTRRRVGQLVDSWKGVMIFWTCLVQVTEVNAHSPFVLGLLDLDIVGQPLWVNYLSDVTGLEEHLDFLLNDCIFSRPKVLLLLLNGPGIGENIQLMCCNRWINSFQFDLLTCKDIIVALQELNYLYLHFWFQLSAQAGGLIALFGYDLYQC